MAKAETKQATAKNEPRLKKVYNETIRKALQEQFGYDNDMQVPRLDKIVLNMGVGEATADSKKPSVAAEDLAMIAGQKAVVTRARNSIAGFKVRENMPIGAKVTLRKERMYEFLDRLVNVALPRVRDFHGVGAKFDKGGNYNLGIVEQSIFPELTFEETQVLHGLQVTFAISNEDAAHSRALLEKFGVPFEKEGGNR